MTNTNWNSEETISITTMDSDYTLNINNIAVDTTDISNITISSASTITLDDTHWADSITWENIEFEDHMPSVAKIEDMCNDYPGLRKAYENFKTIYKMVHQDWQGKQDAGDQFPF